MEIDMMMQKFVGDALEKIRSQPRAPLHPDALREEVAMRLFTGAGAHSAKDAPNFVVTCFDAADQFVVEALARRAK